MGIKNILRFSSYLLLFVFLNSCKEKEKTFTILTDQNLETLKLSNIGTLSSLWPIHKTLFRTILEKKQNDYASDILSKFESKHHHTSFTFCLKNKTLYADLSPITLEDLTSHLVKYCGQHEYTISQDRVNRCVEIKFKKSYFSFFDTLSNQSSPFIRPTTENSAFPIGISPYSLQKQTSSEIVLKYNGTLQSVPYFQKIKIVNITQNDNIISPDEINFLRQYDKDKYIDHNRMSSFEKKSPNVNFISINLPEKLRIQVRSCLNQEALFQIYKTVYGRYPHSPIRSYLPQGVTGYFEAKFSPEKECEPLNKKLRLANFYPQHAKNLEKNLLKYFPWLNISLINYPPTDAISVMQGDPKPYDLIFLGNESKEAKEHLLAFLSPNKADLLIDERPKDLGMLFDELNTQPIPSKEKERLYTQLNNELITRGYVIPLAQIATKFFYPKNLRGVNDEFALKADFYKIENLYENN